MFENFKNGEKPCILCIIQTVALVIIAIVLVCNCFTRKRDYAVMFSENAVATLQQIKAEKWDIINARWAMDQRGAWNYEFIVSKPAPIFGSKKQQRAVAPAPTPAPAPAPVPVQAPKQEPTPVK